MEMKPVKSSQIHAVGYDPATKQMRIQFLSGKDRAPGPVYEYDGITSAQHADLVAAESVGKHFGTYIRGNAAIKFRKLGGAVP